MSSTSIADGLEGFSRQQTDWPKDFPVQIIGHPTAESLLETADEIHVMPAMRGGGGKFTSIVIGAVFVVVGILLLSANPMLGTALIVSGATMILGGVLQLFMKAPSISKNNDPDGSKYLNVNKNTVDVGTLITMAWGEIDLAGQWLSLQSDSNNLATGVFPVSLT